jgi:hypothetical protein
MSMIISLGLKFREILEILEYPEKSNMKKFIPKNT